MTTSSIVLSDFLEFYRFLPVMDGEQIWKLRRIATGILDITAFSQEEIAVLETKLHLDSLTNPSN
jgi:hypothetical protein